MMSGESAAGAAAAAAAASMTSRSSSSAIRSLLNETCVSEEEAATAEALRRSVPLPLAETQPSEVERVRPPPLRLPRREPLFELG